MDHKQMLDSGMHECASDCRAALEAAAPSEPMSQDEQGGCVWCGATDGTPYGYATANPEDHAEDCGWRIARAALAAAQPAPLLDVERQRDEAHVQCLNDREEACRLLVGMLDAFDNRWTGEKTPPQIYYRAERFLNRMLPERLARSD